MSDKAITFIRNIGFSTLDLDLDAYLVIADTGIYGNTREAVEKVAQAEEANLPHLAALGDLTEIVQKAIQRQRYSKNWSHDDQSTRSFTSYWCQH